MNLITRKIIFSFMLSINIGLIAIVSRQTFLLTKFDYFERVDIEHLFGFFSMFVFLISFFFIFESIMNKKFIKRGYRIFYFVLALFFLFFISITGEFNLEEKYPQWFNDAKSLYHSYGNQALADAIGIILGLVYAYFMYYKNKVVSLSFPHPQKPYN